MKRNTLVLKFFGFTLWRHRRVLMIYTTGTSIGPRYLHFGDISDLQSSLIFQKIPFIRPIRQLELPGKVRETGILDSHVVKNSGQSMLESSAMWSINYLSFSFL